jgi:cytochrome c
VVERPHFLFLFNHFNLKRLLYFLALLPLLIFFSDCSHQSKRKKILIFSLTKGWHHTSIPKGLDFFQKLGKSKDIQVDTSTNPRRFQDHFLKDYDVVVFLNTTGDVLNRSQEVAFERYIQAGGSFLGIHSACDTEYDWPWYGKLVGAYFQNHPEIQMAKIMAAPLKGEALLEKIPASFSLEDEWYNFIPESISKQSKQILSIDEKSYQGGKHPENHPMAWYQEFDGGKSFYTAIGHKDETYDNPVFAQLIHNALEWTLDHSGLDYGKAKTASIPDEDKFTQTVLAGNLDEPMEMAVEQNGNVWVVGRKGHIWYWDNENQSFSQKHKMDVWTKYEDGLLGIALDKNYQENHWVYLYYSPNIEESVQYLSRFTIVDQTIDFNSEKILLKVPVQRLECCHSAGSIAVDNNGMLWLSTGDNTNPHKADGYGPIDERENRGPFDAQKSSANSNDLRGKVLRIKPEPNGTYSIPEGNLFPIGTKNCRPEIYVMGCRNPYRISVNENGTGLAWGDVGPDAGKDSVYGPKGHDEVNLTYKPGFFGWPYFIANNIPYSDRNFSDSIPSGPIRNPKISAINNSPRNTGIQKLPLPQPAWIYYPYAKSELFPELGKGGRTAMAGPWIPKSGKGVKLPAYYFGKLIVYDWMRDWVFAVDPNPSEKPKLERILSRFTFSNPNDMEIGPDGSLYVLEYGTNWFLLNADARLSKIEYSLNNHAPVAKIKADKNIGGIPLKVSFSSLGSFDDDVDDSLSYEWRISSASTVDSRKKDFIFNFTKPGIFTVRLVVTDKSGNSAATSMQIKVGNYPPKINIDLAGNQSFYWPGTTIGYQVQIDDKEDGSTRNGKITSSEIKAFSDILHQTEDQTTQAQGHQIQTDEAIGLSLINSSDCKSCHQEKIRSAGPSYLEVANRYRGKPSSLGILGKKVITGGAGNWGDHAMSAHPQLAFDDAKKMVSYILSMKEETGSKSIASKGSFVSPNLNELDQILLSAIYKDKGAPGIESIEEKKTINLRYPKLNAVDYDDLKEAWKKANYGKAPFFMRLTNGTSFLKFNEIDLFEVSQIQVNAMASGDIPLFLEIRTDSAKGPVVGRKQLIKSTHGLDFQAQIIPISASRGKKDLYFTLSGISQPTKGSDIALEWFRFLRKGQKGI